MLRKAIVLQSSSPVLYKFQKLAQSQPPSSSVPQPQPQKYRDDSQRMRNKDENASKKLCLLAHDGFQHRKTRQELPMICIRGKGSDQSRAMFMAKTTLAVDLIEFMLRKDDTI
ncbi:hypothetical protein RB195_018706 [Necator americanus]|uniref:Uncharacterized protein n=1 Tax=Necator americanus TaxID=51031 RepID=A0ABR1CC89_NECAM